MSTLLNELEHEVERAIRRLRDHGAARAVLLGTASAETLACYYVSAFDTVQRAPALLHQSHTQLRTDGGHPELVELLHQKSLEENGHHHWLADDLAAIGFPLGHEKTPKASRAATLYGLFHEQVIPLNGHAFLGTAWVLESLAMRCAGEAAKCLQAHGDIAGLTPSSTAGLSFLYRHQEEDVGHVAELARVIDAYVTSESAQHYVLLCARFTATIYADFFG